LGGHGVIVFKRRARRLQESMGNPVHQREMQGAGDR
jgi:hypothetical protein